MCEDEAGAVIPKMNVNTQVPFYISYMNMSTAELFHRLFSDPIEGRHCLIHHFIHYYVLKLTQSSLQVALFRRGEINGCRLDVFKKVICLVRLPNHGNVGVLAPKNYSSSSDSF